MATDLKSKSPPKHEAFVDQQLGKVRQRIRWLEVGKAALLLLVLTAGYAVVAALFDLWACQDAAWNNSVRLGLLGAFALTAAFLLVQLLVRWFRRVNPYYAALELERNIGDAKNSVVNWLDLRREKLPPVIKQAVGLRAARDLKDADPERAVQAGNNWLLAGILFVLVLALVVLFGTGPRRFMTLMQRAFLPFDAVRVAGTTQIRLLEPQSGNVTVSLQQALTFRADVRGRIPPVNSPGAPRIHFRYGAGDPYASLPLDEDTDGTWTTRFIQDQIKQGFSYYLSAGDDRTEEYQVQVRSLPQAKGFDVVYHYRPYLNLPDVTIPFPNEHAFFPSIRGPRGTQITLTVHTNRELFAGHIELGPDKLDLPGTIVGDKREALSVTFKLEKTGNFRVHFTAKTGEKNTDHSPYLIDVIADGAPHVTLKKPGQDVTLPANGTLPIEGFASDDFGIKNLVLRLRLLDGQNLQPRPYRPDKNLEFAKGGYPRQVDYFDTLPLDQLRSAAAEPFALSKGNVLEYWLEAVDNSDFPSASGNLGKSDIFKINIVDPQDEKKQKEERKQAEQERDKKQQRQDQDLKKQEQEREQKKEAGASEDRTPEQKKQEDELREKAKKLEDALKDQEKTEQDQQKREQAGKQKGESKSADTPPQAENKDENKSDGPQAANKDAGKNDHKPSQQETGAKKEGDQGGGDPNQPKNKDQQSPAQAKDAGQKEGGQDPKSAPAQTKDHGQPKQQGKSDPAQAKGADEQQKTPSSAQDNAKSQAKEGAKEGTKQGAADSPAAAKDQGQGNKDQQPAQAKKESPQQQNQPGGQAKEKRPDNGDGPAPQAKADPNQKPEPGKPPQEAQHGDNKPGPDAKEPLSQAKDKRGGEEKNIAQTKEQGKEPMQSSENQGGAKGTGEPQQTSAKEPGKSGMPPEAKAKNKQPGDEKLASRPKDGPPAKDSSAAAESKDDGAKKNNGQGTAQREPTPEEIAKLKERLQKKGRDADEAAKELAKAAEETKDGELRKDIQEALKKAGKKTEPGQQQDPGQVAKGQKKDPGETGKDPGNKPPENPPAQAKEGDGAQTTAGKGQDPKQKPQQPPAQSKDGDKLQASEKGGVRSKDDKTHDADPNFAKHAGDLNLEDLKKRVTPEVLKKAGFSEAEWQKFVKDAQLYEEMLRQQKSQTGPGPQTLTGDPSKLGNTYQKLSPATKGPLDPLQRGQAQPPPGFREEYRWWTTRPPRPKSP